MEMDRNYGRMDRYSVGVSRMERRKEKAYSNGLMIVNMKENERTIK